MKQNLIFSMNGVVLEYKRGERVYYLAGPTEGGGGWQKKAVKKLTEMDPNCVIVNPCECHFCSELLASALPISTEKVRGKGKRDIVMPALSFVNKTAWIKHYMEQASYHGCIIFWLPEENFAARRRFDLGPYSRDVYSDLARWSVKSANPNEFSLDRHIFKGGRVNLVVGADPGFSGLTEIKESLDADHGKSFTVHSSLTSTIEAAVELAKATNAFPKSLPK